jgi:TP901 family phage tail tape measure protein
MATKVLSLTITTDSAKAIAQVETLIKQYQRLARQLIKVNALTGGKGLGVGMVAAGPGKDMAKNTVAAASKAKKAMGGWTAEITRLRAMQRKFAGEPIISQRIIADMDRVMDKQRKRLQVLGGKATPAQIANYKAVHRSVLSSTGQMEKFHVQAAQMNKEYTRMATMGQRMGLYQKNIAVSSQRTLMTAERLKIVETEIARIMAIRARLAHQLRAARAGGVARPTIITESVASRYVAGQESKWGGMQRGAGQGVVVSDADINRLKQYGMLHEGMRHKVSWLKSFTMDIKSFMHMQIRWFAAAAVLFAIPAIIFAAIRAFGEFQKAIKDIGAVTGATDEELNKLADTALRVSLITPQSATELAKLARMLIQAGLEVKQTTAIMESVAKVATVSGESMEQVGKAFTTAIFAWRMSADESVKIGNVIAATLNFSRLQVEDLATAYNYMASVSSQFNISFEEANSILAIFSNLGLRASTMATGFTQVLTRLVRPPDDFRRKIEESGKSYKEFMSILEDSEPDKIARMIQFLAESGFTGATALRTLGARAGRSLAAALNIGSDAIFVMNKRIRTTEQLTTGFARAMESTANRLARFRNHLVAISVNLGSTFQPAIDAVIHTLTVLGRLFFYATSGLALFGKSSIWVVGGLTTLLVLLAKSNFAFKSLTATVAASRLIFATHPLFFAITAGVGILALIGLLRGSRSEYDKFTKKVEDSSAAIKLMQGNQKELNKVYEEGDTLVQKFRTTLEGLKFSAIALPMPEFGFDRLAAQADAAVIAHSRAVEQIIQQTENLQIALQNIIETNEPSWIEKLIFGITKAGDVEAKRLAAVTEPFRKKIKELVEENRRLKDELARTTKEFIADVERALPGDIGKGLTKLKAASGETLSVRKELELINKQVLALAKEELSAKGLQFDLEAFFEKMGPSIIQRYTSIFQSVDRLVEQGKRKLEEYTDPNNVQKIMQAHRDEVKFWEELHNRMDDPGEFLKEVGKTFDQVIEEVNKSTRVKLTAEAHKMSEAWRDYLFGIERGVVGFSGSLVDKAFQDTLEEAKGNIDDFVSAYSESTGFSAEKVKRMFEPEFAAIQTWLESLGGDIEIFPLVAMKEDELKPLMRLLLAMVQSLRKEWQQIGFDSEDALLNIAKETANITGDTNALFAIEKKLLDIWREEELLKKSTLKTVQERTNWENEINRLYELRLRLQDLEREKRESVKESARIDLLGFLDPLGAVIDRKKVEYGNKMIELREALITGLISPEEAKMAQENLKMMLTPGEFELELLIQGYKEQVAEFANVGERMKSVGREVAQSLSRSFSDFFFSLMRGELDNLADAFDMFVSSLQRAVANFLAEQVVFKFLTMLAGLGMGTVGADIMTTPEGFTTFHKGGLKDYHGGGPVRKRMTPDERLALVQTGEYVVSRKGVKALDAINKGEVSPREQTAEQERPIYFVNHWNIKAMDTQSFAQAIGKHEDLLASIYLKAISNNHPARTQK